MTYPAIYAVAPTLKIVYILKSSPDGLSEDEISLEFNQNNLVDSRIEDLIVENFAFVKNEKLCLTPKGRLLAGVFYWFRKIYGLKMGKAKYYG
ncbi:MAG: hypothetical protein MZV64_27500 [Ignavibacteriales bacterium]|nr:hypothetical protein [Ignavibacteriales bacterium]